MESVMKKLVLMIAGISILLGACASGGGPDWADGGDSKDYPKSRYLTGVGTGTELATAKDRAQVSLATAFSIKIDDVADAAIRQAKKAGGNIAPHINTARVERIISNRKEKLLTGAKVVETWQGPETRAFYALAALPRSQASNNLKQEITRLDKATGGYVRRSEAEGDILRQVRAASIALDAQVARMAYQQKLRVVDRSSNVTASRWQLAKLGRDLERLLLRVRIAPQVGDDKAGTLTTSTSAALAGSGFQPSDMDSAEFILITKLDFENLGYRDKWYWSRGVLTVTLKEKVSGRQRGTVRWAMKAAGASTGDAEQSIASKVDSVLKRQLRETIIKFAVR
jgi:hypothetical protein